MKKFKLFLLKGLKKLTPEAFEFLQMLVTFLTGGLIVGIGVLILYIATLIPNVALAFLFGVLGTLGYISFLGTLDDFIFKPAQYLGKLVGKVEDKVSGKVKEHERSYVKEEVLNKKEDYKQIKKYDDVILNQINSVVERSIYVGESDRLILLTEAKSILSEYLDRTANLQNDNPKNIKLSTSNDSDMKIKQDISARIAKLELIINQAIKSGNKMGQLYDDADQINSKIDSLSSNIFSINNSESNQKQLKL